MVVRETIPDSLFDGAAEVEVVDLAPPELLQRLRDGKVYVPDMAARAIDRFFDEENMVTLRDLALRRAEERVDAQMQTRAIPRREPRPSTSWSVSPRTRFPNGWCGPPGERQSGRTLA